jgi:hypothetical protein
MSPIDTGETAGATVESVTAPPWWSMASIRGKIQDEMDQQRHERLAQCRSLESVLADCHAQRTTTKTRTQLEDIPAGIRMVRYFDWRDVPDPHCQREAHAVWACRAVALQCGGELLKVRDCFHQTLPTKTTILEYPNGTAAYNPSSSPSSSKDDFVQDEGTDAVVPCARLQQSLGRCVSTNAHALLERDTARRQRK